jgi:hypothetical protein
MVHRIICRAQWICLISVLLGFPATASAQVGDGMIIFAIFLQQLNKVADLSAGFSMARGTNTPGGERVIPIGLQFGTTIDVHKSLGIDVDLAVQSGKPAGPSDMFNMFEYLFGPRFSAHTRRTTVFCHALAGGVHHWQDSPADAPANYQGGGFAMAYGGGVDVNVSERIAIRVVQFDWIPFREDGSWKTNTMRLGFGVVLRSAK